VLRQDLFNITMQGADASRVQATIDAMRERLRMIEQDCIAIVEAKIWPLMPP
jgi:hypothetical protein